MATDPVNYYELLGIQKGASAEEIRKAYRKLSRTAHPDTGGNDGLFRFITLAYDTLSNPDSRARYDAGFGPQQTQQKPTRAEETPSANNRQEDGYRDVPNSQEEEPTSYTPEDERTWYWPRVEPKLGKTFGNYYKKYNISHLTARRLRNFNRVLVVAYFLIIVGVMVWEDVNVSSWGVAVFSNLFTGVCFVFFTFFAAIIAKPVRRFFFYLFFRRKNA